MERYRHNEAAARFLNSDRVISTAAMDLLDRATDNPDDYWHDIENWLKSENPVRRAEGNIIAGMILRVEDPDRAITYVEEARRLFIGQNYYPEAATAAHALSLLCKHGTGDQEAVDLYRELAQEYRAIGESRKHPRIEPRVMDDDDR